MAYGPSVNPHIQHLRRHSRHVNPILVILVVGLAGWIIYREFLPSGRKGRDTEPAHAHQVARAPGPDSSAPVLLDARNETVYQVGQHASYGISTELVGKGTPGLEGTTGLHLCFDTDYTVTIENVAEDGSATVQARFGDANVYGNQFGYPVNVVRRSGIIQSYAPPASPAITALNKNYDGPDLTAFDAPVTIHIDPAGCPVEDTEAGKVGLLLAALVRLSGTAFPDSEIWPGMTWERRVKIALPGLKHNVEADVTSTLIGTDSIWGIPCMYIENVIKPAASGERDGAPLLRRVKELAHIEVVGSGSTYYDPVTRMMLASKSEIEFNLILAGSLQSAADLFGSYGGILDEIEGGPEFDLAEYSRSAGKEPIGLRVSTVIERKK